MFKPLSAAFIYFSLLAMCTTSSLAAENEMPIVFKAQSGESTEAFSGTLSVPENRNDPQSRTIQLHYVRFPATTQQNGTPIIYLAGGPGGSGIATAKHRRYPLFMAMREFGDVIAFDQRGTGESNDMPHCEPETSVPLTSIVDDEALAGIYRAAAVECADFWEQQGIDLTGYSTVQSAQDLDALRRHLGADKVSLWGISYGSHLALAALKQMQGRIDRIIIASAEGLDQTVKLPARTDAYFARLQAAVNSQPDAAAAFPDIPALVRRVHQKLEAKPVMVNLRDEKGEPVEYLLQRPTMQRMASAMISDPGAAAAMLRIYAAADQGEFEPAIEILQRYFSAGDQLSLRAMPLAMDVASGVSEQRLDQVKDQARTALLGAYLNFPMPQLVGALPELELDDDFRAGPNSDAPTLLLSGTLDGRTYPEGQLEATAGLSNLQTITVVNAGHNLFMTTPEVTQTMQRFMRGEPLKKTEITIPLPDFSPTE